MSLVFVMHQRRYEIIYYYSFLIFIQPLQIIRYFFINFFSFDIMEFPSLFNNFKKHSKMFESIYAILSLLFISCQIRLAPTHEGTQ